MALWLSVSSAKSLPMISLIEKPTIIVSNSIPPRVSMIAADIANGRTSGASRISVTALIAAI
jgi:hypothetical protein